MAERRALAALLRRLRRGKTAIYDAEAADAEHSELLIEATFCPFLTGGFQKHLPLFLKLV
jgi:hypothetical protein